MHASLRATYGALALVTVCGQDAAAGNLSFLDDSAITKFNDEDVRLMRENLQAVADDGKTPSERSWKNPATGHEGSIESLKAFTGHGGLACKKLRVTNIASDLQSRAVYTMCKSNEGDWRLAPKEPA